VSGTIFKSIKPYLEIVGDKIKQMNWNLVVNIFIALGLFEVVKKIIFHYIDNNIIKRNIEIREISNRFMDYCLQLKQSEFRHELSREKYDQATIDIIKFRALDNDVASSMSWLILAPTIFTAEKQIAKFQPIDEQQTTEYINNLIKTADTMIDKCNKYRYQPIVNVSPIKTWIKKAKNKLTLMFKN